MGIDKIKTLVSRGVLLDVARARGVEEVEDGHAITGDDLDKAAALGKVDVRAGDIALVRTGRMARFFRDGRDAYNAMPVSGPSLQSVEWFHDHDVAAVATDTIVFEVYPSEREDAAARRAPPPPGRHGHDTRSELELRGARRRLCCRRSLHLLPRRVAHALHRRCRKPGEPDRDQVGAG